MRHARVDAERHGDAVRGCLFGQFLIFCQKQLVPAGLNEEGRQPRKIRIDGGEARVLAVECARVGRCFHGVIERRSDAEHHVLGGFCRARSVFRVF